jgi:hypothetical protein
VADNTYNVLFICTGNSARSLKRRINPMLALPLSTLDSMATRRELRDIGER